jgi:hypothetical protein
MKRFLFAAAAVVAAVTVPAFAADVGVSVQVGEPGFYGRIDVGNFPQPQVIYAKPVVIQPVPVGVVREPIYLRVPPGHAKNWRKHCHQYNACGQPVYFVKDGWYNKEYAPRYRESHGEGHGERHGDERGEGRDHGHGKKGKDHRDD